MNHVIASALFGATLLTGGCRGSADQGKDHGRDPATAAKPSETASFSYKIDGKEFSGTGTDNAANCASRISGGRVRFVLMSLSGKAPPQFNIAIADHGTTSVTRDDMDQHSSNGGTFYTDFSVPPLDPDHPVPNYRFNSGITITITEISATRVSGTFSGDLRHPDTEKKVDLTEGTFDLPFCRHGAR